MTASGYVHLDFDRIEKETEKALLVEFGDRQVWIPLSQVADPDDYSEGDQNGTISVREWFAEKEGLA